MACGAAGEWACGDWWVSGVLLRLVVAVGSFNSKDIERCCFFGWGLSVGVCLLRCCYDIPRHTPHSVGVGKIGDGFI